MPFQINEQMRLEANRLMQGLAVWLRTGLPEVLSLLAYRGALLGKRTEPNAIKVPIILSISLYMSLNL